MTSLILPLTLFVLIIGVPLGYMLGVISLAGLMDMGGWPFLRIIATRFHSGVESFLLIAIPFFILAAMLMNKSGLTDRLIRFVNLLIGHYPGGLSHVNIGGSIIFAGMTGAAVTDTVAIGNVLIPAMKREGYSAEFSAAVTAASSIVGPVIPPSITMIVYSHITGLSVGSLFSAGFLPGLLMGLLLLVVSAFISAWRHYPRREARAPLREILFAGKDAILALIVPVIILGSILTGLATVTESAAVAVGYSFFVGKFIFRTLKFKDLIPAALYTAKLTGVIFLLLATAHTFGWYITRLGVPTMVSQLILGLTTNPIIVLAMINVFLLLIGMIMDILPAVLILAPVLAPAMAKVGVDPLHFALIMLVNLNIGMITPPYGMTLLTSARIADCSYDKTIVAVTPFLVALLVALILITYVPWFVLALPRLFGFAG
ncbi:MAG: TRAP transporter large permease [Deltaproteobacteria bacterium]|nr:TRAP transporter large permease [Deltaproteobacteria bacterium]